MRKLSNDYIVEGSTVRVDVSTKKHPNVETLIDIEDIDLILDGLGRWYCSFEHPSYPPYVVRNKKPEPGSMKLHSVILKRFSGNIIQVDHKDGDTLNNKRHNLRPCTSTQNQQNRTKRARSSSQYKGVSYCKKLKKYRARIRINTKLKHLGCFQNEIDAALAYDKAAEINFGEFARLNLRYQS